MREHTDTLDGLARIAFDAYNAQAGGLTWDGKPIPPFGEVGEGVQANWRAAVHAVRARLDLRQANLQLVRRWWAFTQGALLLQALDTEWGETEIIRGVEHGVQCQWMTFVSDALGALLDWPRAYVWMGSPDDRTACLRIGASEEHCLELLFHPDGHAVEVVPPDAPGRAFRNRPFDDEEGDALAYIMETCRA